MRDSTLDKPGEGADKDKRGTDKYGESSCAPCGPWVCVCFGGGGLEEQRKRNNDGMCRPCGDDHESDNDDNSERKSLLDSSEHKSG